MAASLSTFRVRFPEFDAVQDPLVQAALDEADLSIDRDEWKTKADAGQMYLAAHKLALSPYGQQARLVAKDGSSTYEAHYKGLMMSVAIGAVVP